MGKRSVPLNRLAQLRKFDVLHLDPRLHVRQVLLLALAKCALRCAILQLALGVGIERVVRCRSQDEREESAVRPLHLAVRAGQRAPLMLVKSSDILFLPRFFGCCSSTLPFVVGGCALSGGKAGARGRDADVEARGGMLLRRLGHSPCRRGAGRSTFWKKRVETDEELVGWEWRRRTRQRLCAIPAGVSRAAEEHKVAMCEVGDEVRGRPAGGREALDFVMSSTGNALLSRRPAVSEET